MTRKELESACRFMMAFESDLSIEEINKTFSVQLEESSSHEQALSAYIESASLQLDTYPSNKYNIAKEALSECDRQVEKWGVQNHHPMEWQGLFLEEIGEAAKEVNEFTFVQDPKALDRLRYELIQSIAVGISFIDSLDRNQFKEREVKNDNIRNS